MEDSPYPSWLPAAGSRYRSSPSLVAPSHSPAWLPVPRVIEHGSDGYDEWLLTAGLPGVNAVDDALRGDPARLVPLLAGGLRRFHVLPGKPEISVIALSNKF